jgi:hypothetical protein
LGTAADSGDNQSNIDTLHKDRNRRGPAMGVQLSDQDKIDRAAFHEEVRFYKRQQWAVATAGVVLLGAFLATVHDVHMTALEKSLAVVLIAVGLGTGCYFLDSLQEALATVRRRLNPFDRGAATRGLDIMYLHKAILVVSALVVVCALFKHGGQADRSLHTGMTGGTPLIDYDVMDAIDAGE